MVGGAEKSLLLLLKNIDRKRFDPVVVIPYSGVFEDELNSLGIKTYKVKYTWWVRDPVNIQIFIYCIILELFALPRFINIIRKEKIKVVYTNTIVIFSGAIAAFLTRTPHIWHIREIIKHNPGLCFFFPDKMLLDFVKKFSNRIIAISQAVADQFSNNNLNKINVVPNAIDIHAFEGNTSIPDIKGVNPEDYLVAVIGPIQERKAQDYAIRAVKTASRKIPNIKLLLIGRDSYDFKRKLEQLILELCLSDKVIFTGHRNDIDQIYPYCKIILMPSLNEPFGRTTIEAMAAGIPVIGTNSGGTKEILQDGITGYLVSPEDPSEMAERIIKLYDNPELAKRFGNNGKKIVQEKYNMERHIQSIEKNIIEIIC
jgi:glycosyltransferase involved in cell wall biosynthesis